MISKLRLVIRSTSDCRVGLVAAALLVSVAMPADAEVPVVWRDTLERIQSGVVAIRVDSTRAFDTEWNQSSEATGFVVDAAQGLILTNRHVVTTGPVRAEALFVNQEEVELTPVYRDPVHDFGFFRFDPADLKYIEPAQLELASEGAEIGREIRVVGNDAGEQLSILSGTIARLRRHAPEYGSGKYNDFNTFYMQAASGTSGGSSGSPVIDIEGRVVALNAGANVKAASSFFLPLDRVERALELLQDGLPVTRGTLESVFRHVAYDELRRLGLKSATEEAARTLFPDQTGMLILAEIIPAGAADEVLEVGDILVRVNGEFVTDFVSLEELLDANVGAAVELEIERNGKTLVRTLEVQNLHEITPAEYIQFGDAVVHKLSYQQARSFNRAIRGVYVANPGYVLGNAAVPRGSVIVSVDGAAIENLDDFEQAITGLADLQRAAFRFFTFEDPQASKLRLVRMDRRWFPAMRCSRNDDAGSWPCTPLADPPPLSVEKPATAGFVSHADSAVRRVLPSLVLVNFDMPYTLSGVSERHYYGTGVIVDADLGYIVVDRNTVPEAMGDVHITFAGSVEVRGEVAFVHPLHNLALVSYDPELIGETPVRSARLSFDIPDPGDEVLVVGLRGDHKVIHQATKVASVEPVFFPLSRTMRFRDTNLETLDLVNGPTDIDGVILDRRGRVVSMWSSFAYQGGGELNQENKGLPAELLHETVALVRDGKPLRSLEIELRQMPMSGAREFGLPQAWADRLEAHDPTRRQVLAVTRAVAGTSAAELLMPGDLLLSVEGEPVTRFREVERAMQTDIARLEIIRNGVELSIDVPTVALEGRGVRRAAMWGGALLQSPYRDMAAQRGIEPYGVYVAYFGYGSPASRYGMFAGRRIVAADGIDTPDLDSFLATVAGKGDGDSVRLTTVTWNNVVEVLTLELDDTYWPSYEIRYENGAWARFPTP